MTSRRDFLRRGSIALAGGLLLGDAAIEAFEMLMHRKVWAGVTFTAPTADAFVAHMNWYANLMMKKIQLQLHQQMMGSLANVPVIFDPRCPPGMVVLAPAYRSPEPMVQVVRIS